MEVVFPPPTTSNKSHSIFANSKPTPRRRSSIIISEVQEIRVCTNRSCRRQGSMQTLETITALAPPTVAVKSCGCLRRCGNGPNLVALPACTLVGHCGTRARAAEVLVALCGGEKRGAWDSDADDKSLAALALRNKAEIELNNNNFTEAELFLSQAIELRPIGGIHIFKDRAIARLALGNHSGALEDAAQALALNPLYPEAYICQGDVFLAMSHFDSVHKSYLTALQIDPSIRRSKSFMARMANLKIWLICNVSEIMYIFINYKTVMIRVIKFREFYSSLNEGLSVLYIYACWSSYYSLHGVHHILGMGFKTLINSFHWELEVAPFAALLSR